MIVLTYICCISTHICHLICADIKTMDKKVLELIHNYLISSSVPFWTIMLVCKISCHNCQYKYMYSCVFSIYCVLCVFCVLGGHLKKITEEIPHCDVWLSSFYIFYQTFLNLLRWWTPYVEDASVCCVCVISLSSAPNYKWTLEVIYDLLQMRNCNFNYHSLWREKNPSNLDLIPTNACETCCCWQAAQLCQHEGMLPLGLLNRSDTHRMSGAQQHRPHTLYT